MPLLKELGTAVRRRRQEIGLSQQQLAGLVELSRATVNELETGKLADLSSNRIERVANELGFAVGLVGTRRARDRGALEAAARLASVSYASELPPQLLLDSLRTGSVPPGHVPHLRALLQEAPVAVFGDLADELYDAHQIPKRRTWSNMRLLARVLNCDRGLWLTPST
jgi:transcriptional regulator with XRE-family HTH domain